MQIHQLNTARSCQSSREIFHRVFGISQKVPANHASEMCGGSGRQRRENLLMLKGRTEVTTYAKVGGFHAENETAEMRSLIF